MDNWKEKKESLLARFEGCVADVAYYDRKDCEDLSIEDVEELISGGYVTKEEILQVFEKELSQLFKNQTT